MRDQDIVFEKEYEVLSHIFENPNCNSKNLDLTVIRELSDLGFVDYIDESTSCGEAYDCITITLSGRLFLDLEFQP